MCSSPTAVSIINLCSQLSIHRLLMHSSRKMDAMKGSVLQLVIVMLYNHCMCVRSMCRIHQIFALIQASP